MCQQVLFCLYQYQTWYEQSASAFGSQSEAVLKCFQHSKQAEIGFSEPGEEGEGNDETTGNDG